MWGTGAFRQTVIVTLCGLLAIAAGGCDRDSAGDASRAAGDSSVASLQTEKTGDAGSLAAAMPVGGEWRLVAIDHRELSSGGTPVVVFGEEGKCWGNTGVNDFRTTFRLGGRNQGSLEFGNAAVTRKAGPPEAMALERLFLERLETAKSFEVEGNLLHLHAGDGQHLTLERVLP